MAPNASCRPPPTPRIWTVLGTDAPAILSLTLLSAGPGRPALGSQQSPGSQAAALTPVGLECVRAEQQEGCTAGSGQVTGIWHLLKVNKKPFSHFPLLGTEYFTVFSAVSG